MRFDTAEKVLTDLVLEGMDTELEAIRDDINELVEEGELGEEEAETLLESNHEIKHKRGSTTATFRFGEHMYIIRISKPW